VPEGVVARILTDPSMLHFGGERKDISILFFDVRSFTSYSERRDAEQVVVILHGHLTRMVDAVFRNDGTLDKFVGDAVMAIFGAPVSQPDHAVRSCRTGLAMMAELRQLEQKRGQDGTGPLPHGRKHQHRGSDRR
jgi:adenylate cyclase